MSVPDRKVRQRDPQSGCEFLRGKRWSRAISPVCFLVGPSSGRDRSWGSHYGRRQLATASLFALVSLAILLPGLGRPKAMFFDEAYFVPEARAFIQGVPNPEPHAPPLAKPPLGKLIMAIGMKTAGDNSFGWRIAGSRMRRFDRCSSLSLGLPAVCRMPTWLSWRLGWLFLTIFCL